MLSQSTTKAALAVRPRWIDGWYHLHGLDPWDPALHHLDDSDGDGAPDLYEFQSATHA